MTKEQIALFYSIAIVLILIISSIVCYKKDKEIKRLRSKINELDEIYFDEIEELAKLIEKEEAEVKENIKNPLVSVDTISVKNEI